VAVSPIMNLFAGDPERTVELILKRGARATLRITMTGASDRRRGTQDSRSRRHRGILQRTYSRTFKPTSRRHRLTTSATASTARTGARGASRGQSRLAYSMRRGHAVADDSGSTDAGQVVDAASGAPVAKGAVRAGELPGAQLQLNTAPGASAGRRFRDVYAQTDADGRAVLRSCATAHLRLRILAPATGMAVPGGRSRPGSPSKSSGWRRAQAGRPRDRGGGRLFQRV